MVGLKALRTYEFTPVDFLLFTMLTAAVHRLTFDNSNAGHAPR